jgi:hypothetical protein
MKHRRSSIALLVSGVGLALCIAQASDALASSRAGQGKQTEVHYVATNRLSPLAQNRLSPFAQNRLSPFAQNRLSPFDIQTASGDLPQGNYPVNL